MIELNFVVGNGFRTDLADTVVPTDDLEHYIQRNVSGVLPARLSLSRRLPREEHRAHVTEHVALKLRRPVLLDVLPSFGPVVFEDIDRVKNLVFGLESARSKLAKYFLVPGLDGVN
jgi:hypothetical protein